MGKKMGMLAVLFAAILVLSESDNLFAQTTAAQKSAPAAAANVGTARSARPRVGLGFNGIPLDGSHREATALRRAYRRR